jgi:hypothetical protein
MKQFRFLFLLLLSVTVFSQGIIPQGNATSVVKNPGGYWTEKWAKMPVTDDNTATPNIPNIGKYRLNSVDKTLEYNDGVNWIKLSYTQKAKTAFVDENGSNLTGVLGNPNKPFASPEAACNALPSTGGFVVIGVGSFFSPPKDAIKDNTKFIGTGKPITNSIYSYTSIGVQPTISSPTKLVGGTILLGMFDGSLKDGIELHNLGVDTGLDWCNTYNGGVATDAIRFAQLFGSGLPSADGQHQLQSNSRPRTGVVINNVSALAKSSDSAVHAMLVENCQNPKVSNVSTYYGYYGLVIKAIGANINGLDAHGHGVDGLILKSNDYAYCQSVSVSNVYITSIVGFDGGGLRFHGAETPLSFCSISNINIEFTKYGIVDQGTSTGLMLDNITIFNTQGNGVTFSPTTTFSTINNLDQRSGTIGLSVNNSGTSNIWHLSNIKCSSNSVEGISLYSPTSNKIYCNNVLAIYNTSEYSKGGNVFGNINDTNVFEKATVATAPTNPTDVVRLTDLSGYGDIKQNGNSFGADMVIGTNDANFLRLEYNNSTKLSLSNASLNFASGVSLTGTGNQAISWSSGNPMLFSNVGAGSAFRFSTSSTNAIDDILIYRRVSTDVGGVRNNGAAWGPVAVNNDEHVRLDQMNTAITNSIRSTINTSYTSVPSAATLNSDYPAWDGKPYFVVAPNITGSPMIFCKYSASAWTGFSGVSVP